MKLLHCLNCKDVRALTQATRYCACRKSSGRYIDDRNAEYRGPSVLLGMVNSEIVVIKPDSGVGKWFVIPSTARTVKKTDLTKSEIVKQLAEEMGHKVYDMKVEK